MKGDQYSGVRHHDHDGHVQAGPEVQLHARFGRAERRRLRRRSAGG